MVTRPDSLALPSEPLLDTPTHGLEAVSVDREVHRLLEELACETDVVPRAHALYAWCRKHLGDPLLSAFLQGTLAAAAQGEQNAIGALAALVAVRAPGAQVIERVREFRNLHRMAERYKARQARAKILEPSEVAMLARLETVTAMCAPMVELADADTSGLPSPLDLGPARVPRMAFSAIVKQLEERGVLGIEAMERFVALARLELTASEQRASALAGSINPYSVRAVSVTMPILSALDTEMRDLAGFVDALDAQRRPTLFQDQHALLADHLEPPELDAFLGRLTVEPRLRVGRRLIGAVQRRPMPGRAQVYYTDRLLHVLDVLHRAKLRPARANVVDALLLTLEFADDRGVTLPAGREVVEALAAQAVAGVEATDGELRVLFDPAAARRVQAPAGLPLPPPAEDELQAVAEQGEETVKDLVLANINNTSVLLGLLRNAKVYTTPGIVALIASTSRTLRVLEEICESKPLHTGFANKNVPLVVLKTPARLPIKTLRKFIHVKYVSKMELRRLLNDRTGVRRELWDEIKAYLEGLD